MPYDIQIGELTRALIRRYVLKGSPSFKLDEVVTPVAVVDTLEDFSARLAAGREGTGAVAGDFSLVQLLNPAGSGIVCRVTDVWMENRNGTDMALQFFDTGPLNTVSSELAWRDRRKSALSPLPACIVSAETSLTDDGSNERFAIIAGVEDVATHVPNLNVTLNPGEGMIASSSVIFQAVRVGFFWEERALLPGQSF